MSKAEIESFNCKNVWAPEYLGAAFGPESSAVLLPDGAIRFFYTDKSCKPSIVYSRTSSDGGTTWGEPQAEFQTPSVAYPEPDSPLIDSQTWYATASLLDPYGEIHVMFQVYYGAGMIGVTRFMDVYHIRTTDGRTAWAAPVPIRSRIWCGAAKGLTLIQRDAGWRLIATFGEWIVPRIPGVGELNSRVYYSDNNGETWLEALYEDGLPLRSPISDDFNGANYGAIEGCVVEMSTQALHIYLRTQTGYLYESESADSGGTWSIAKPSRFRSSSSPAYAVRLKDGRVILFWCNQPQLPRMEAPGGGVLGIYSGRDALHAAISDDGGATWKGYREVYLDPKRNEQAVKGDVGVSYPDAIETAEGNIFLTCGQGNTTAMFRFRPEWLYETRHEDDFSQGLDGWSTFTAHYMEQETPGLGKKPMRSEGATLVEHPERIGSKVLHVRKAEPQKAADGAVWNFPGGNGNAGTVQLRMKFNKGFSGAWICLNDAFYDPWYSDGETNAIFKLKVSPDGTIENGERLELDRWHTLSLSWDLSRRSCEVLAEGMGTVVTLTQINQPADGAPICYLRLKCTAAELSADTFGFNVESVSSDTGADKTTMIHLAPDGSN
ncbi:sialidase family protein [Paenibacillus ginsengarvi]|uniref:Exo-alpha-sialidase n=1 Tax=Paenibacillus ginsengarvi TaxID=400777 RepID=A0A3B0CMI7_9BACL|nr:sialidase family protein [Paenibacillus ginsengarvi]RKN86170.1 exo-alpha-sialidase [Paenibacillus ginsengarvi]